MNTQKLTKEQKFTQKVASLPVKKKISNVIPAKKPSNVIPPPKVVPKVEPPKKLAPYVPSQQLTQQQKTFIKKNVSKIGGLEGIQSVYDVRKELQKYLGRNVVMVYIVAGKTVFNKSFSVPSVGFGSWWKTNKTYIMKDSSESIFDEYDNKGTFYIYPENKAITPKKIMQAFKDGVTHCMLSPIREWAQSCLNSANSVPSKKRYKNILGWLDIYDVKYANGIPENDLSDVCNTLQVDINITLPFQQTKLIECKSLKKRLRSFNFVNTRVNHVDLNEVTSRDTFELVTQEQLNDLKTSFEKDGTYFTYNKNYKNISTLHTIDKIYKVDTSDYSNCVNDFEEKSGLKYCKVDDVKQEELSHFIRRGVHYNCTVDFTDQEEFEYMYHIDMKKAYTAYKTCQYYEGFLGKITDFRKTNKMNGVGLYHIKNINFSNANPVFVAYNNHLRIYCNDNVYPSCELSLLTSMGVTYEIVAGCWGINAIDFDFTSDMIEKKTEEGVSYYAKYCGSIDSHNMERTFWMNCNDNFVSIIKEYYDPSSIRFFENGELCVSYPKEHNYHLSHITAFITAYQRLNVIEQLMKIDINNVVRVCVDGIYHLQHEVELCNVFRQKDDFNFNNEAGLYYCSGIFDYQPQQVRKSSIMDYYDNPTDIPAVDSTYNMDYHQERTHYEKELWIGAGGNGKTHKNLTDNGLCRVLYCAPSWKLARKKSEEYKAISTTVWARVITSDIERVNETKMYYNTLVFDEVSMMTEDQKQYIFNTYGMMKLIFCGDLNYQLPPFEGVAMNTTGFDVIVENNINYRCKDARLSSILLEVRDYIKEGLSMYKINANVLNTFKQYNRIINRDTLQKMYTIKDMILAGTNDVKNDYTSMFVNTFQEEKYYILSTNRMYSNGDIVISQEKPDIKCEPRHCFTVHSVQGETCDYNLYIDSSRMFDPTMFYTAISRARTLDNIYIVQ